MGMIPIELANDSTKAILGTATLKDGRAVCADDPVDVAEYGRGFAVGLFRAATSETMEKHTPRPWKAISEDNGEVWSIVSKGCSSTHPGPHGKWITSVYQASEFGHSTPTEAEANARLIAAAPDLLMVSESLSAIGHTIRDDSPGRPLERILANARSAIAKATGKGDAS